MAEYIERGSAMRTAHILRPEDKELMSAISIIPAVSVPQWISVKDRLPDVSRTVSGYEEITVIATDGESVRPMIYERACIRDKTKYRWKWIWDRIYEGKPIVAWMPLPEPPKGENDG